MAYIGNQPTEAFTTFATQTFSTSATSSYTLDHAVTNENEIALIKFITLWPRVLELAARNHEPHRICYYLIELASNFHSLWSKGKDDNNIKFVLEGNHVLTNSRLS